MYKAQKLKNDVKLRRIIMRDISMQVASTEIGISKATLHRIENAKKIDVQTLDKVINWLGFPASEYFTILKEQDRPSMNVHFSNK
jgi:DNA-binding Xre family transcriptional regulator